MNIVKRCLVALLHGCLGFAMTDAKHLCIDRY